MNQGGGATTSDLRTSAPILSRDRMVAVQGELSAIASKNVNLFRATNQAPKSIILVDDFKKALLKDKYNHDVDIFPTTMDAPIEIQLQAMRERVKPKGFYNHKTGRVGIILENLDNIEDGVRTARHEKIGHYAVENMLNDTDPKLLPKLLNQITLIRRTGLNPVINEYSERVLDSQPSLVVQEGDSKQVEAEKNERIAKEVIALMAEDNAHHGIVRQVLDAIRKFLKKIGFLKSDVTDAEITSLLRDAREYLKAGGKDANVRDMRLPALAAFSAKVNETLPDTITVDGIERPTLNSNGKPIYPTIEGIENFWRWFNDASASRRGEKGVVSDVREGEVGGRNRATDDQTWKSSGVLDNEGRPIVLYHGTGDSFDTFEHDHPNKKDYGWLGCLLRYRFSTPLKLYTYR